MSRYIFPVENHYQNKREYFFPARTLTLNDISHEHATFSSHVKFFRFIFKSISQTNFLTNRKKTPVILKAAGVINMREV